ncbi:2-amino-4-hydroxy-6-hydroxymethyldihydropteridine diphosphokinase [Dyadobacter chenwenxiniae]|uniref:2-amino-4-hydroxy-6-hydroxymethyldihydropteridine pyrophosphokinase n=1 Tax=Dyadobacter chenwenxiniae TaxID=2906456 RepID=A0A9X1PTI9_9BACT|nr:2-amino-4-hydroxy-6-hydroxymethyldihydropteridine diphosphokinase [Dyadobacter chenwenxiniae]MCF0065373.1 2-amino-4-hydroxy-6-hydroxymethyldihydropteridine diphosphokinase [Dyadobacter chenwenxiniae]UON82215.1 2-amino-4-hydroxy-6-hydroxymethyldihydropteridine diphosphokinase [Dyadobacter chenwenxiniae]
MAGSEGIFLSLGSNLGDRQATLASAREEIAKRIGTISGESSVYETEPWGLADQPAFLNQVIRVETALAPEEVLRIILDIEHELGRVRHERWGARVIDIDLLYYNALVLDSASLTLPHPRLQDRLFNLIPLTEIAPDFINPLLKKTSLELLQMCTDDGVVSKIS